MANEEHVKILRQGAETWNRWRQEHREILPELTEANLRGADLIGADLSGADLRHANLNLADLKRADLSGANLTRADLNRADLNRADLSDANLWGGRLPNANLSGADLSGADLSGADLWGANLKRVDLSGADLSGANLSHANLIYTNIRAANFENSVFGLTEIGAVDLSEAVGLVYVTHDGPSSIGTDALEQTRAGLSADPSRQAEVVAFLRGAGVDEGLLQFWIDQIPNPIEFYSCFISYSHENKSFARRIYSDLQAAGIRCWLDEHQILPGDRISEQIDKGIRTWDKVLLCCSKTSLSSSWVDEEVDRALEKEERLWKKYGKRVLALIPADLDGHLFDWQGDQADVLRGRSVARLEGWETDNSIYGEQVKRIVDALRADDGVGPDALGR